MECVIEEFTTNYHPRSYPAFEEGRMAVKRDFESWVHNTLPLPEEYSRGKDLAAYITWSCVVPAEGILTRPAMYMSKNWMTNIWTGITALMPWPWQKNLLNWLGINL